MKDPKKSILIVDDERGTRETLGKFLRMSYDVTLAEDGMTAINLINRNEYDLVLSDIRMGAGPDGMNVLDATLQKDPPPPCILFTAYGSIENAVEAVKHGAFDFLLYKDGNNFPQKFFFPDHKTTFMENRAYSME